MAGHSMPVAEVDVDEALVRALLTDQMPDLADLPLALVANGWDNMVFRLGGDLTVRLPRRAMSAVLVEHEQRWLPELAGRLPLPIPVPVRAGRPALGYPWSWSVCRWLPGRVALEQPPADLQEAAMAIGAFLRALHVEAPADAPVNPVRGVPLSHRDEVVRSLLPTVAAVDPDIDTAVVEQAWDAALAVPVWTGPRIWLHGDMHAANVLVDGGRVSAVIDFGDITGGDPATDLAIGWMLFDRASRSTLRASLGHVDDDTWRRGRGWALMLGVVLTANSADNPPFRRLGRSTLREVLADAHD